MKKLKNMCFCMFPAAVGVLIILFNLLIVFNKDTGILYKNFNLAFLWLIIGLALISYSIISIYDVCKNK